MTDAEIIAKWSAISVSTEPIDRPFCEDAAVRLYQSVGLPPPRVCFAESPADALLQRAEYCFKNHGDGQPDVRLIETVFKEILEHLGWQYRSTHGPWARIGSKVTAVDTDTIERIIWGQLGYGLSPGEPIHLATGSGTSRSPRWSGWQQQAPGVFAMVDASAEKRSDASQAALDLSEHAGWMLVHNGICWICERPEILSVDDRMRFHSTTGPALRLGNEIEVHFIHGVAVNAEWIEHPENIGVLGIRSVWNAEIRRVLLDLYGRDRYLKESGAKKLSEDASGTLWGISNPRANFGNTVFGRTLASEEVFVEVENSTPEPDGTRKHYFLQVPPDTMTAKQAVAWTFGRAEREYEPKVET